MKRFLAALMGVALLTSLAGSAWAQAASWPVPHSIVLHTFKHADAGTARGNDGVTGYDSTYTCGISTNLVDTTAAFPGAKIAYQFLGGTADTTHANIKCIVVPKAGTAATVGAMTLTLQGSPDGYTWSALTAATALNIVTGNTSAGSVGFRFGEIGSWGFQQYRFIVTGVAATTGCFTIYVTYPAASPEEQ